jgi:hypothetical protein
MSFSSKCWGLPVDLSTLLGWWHASMMLLLLVVVVLQP